MSNETIFDKIIAGEMDADVVYEDERALAFRDIDPQAPVHDLIIPKSKIKSVNEVQVEDEELVGILYGWPTKLRRRRGSMTPGTGW